ncbi:MAG: hypothetical protein ACJ790_21405 [Myxococcaceae bacterium]
MSQPIPPQIQEAMMQVQSAARAVEGKDVDLIAGTWAEIEKTVIKLLGGQFQMNRQDHLVIALGLSGYFAARLNKEHGAFWFPNRDAMEGATLGFPEALIMLSPFGSVADGLTSGNLSRLEDISKDIRNTLAQHKFSVQGGPAAQQRLTPDLYMRLFDPGFLQFIVVDKTKTKEALESTPDKLSREVKDALGRAREIPNELKQQLQGQIVQALERLEPGKPLIDQAQRAPRAIELITHLFATTAGTGSAPEEFWGDIILPLLHIGAPDSFPPIEGDEVEAVKQGADPMLLFVDVVPFTTPADEGGLLGVFPSDELDVPHPKMASIAPLRLIQVPKARILPMLEKFDPKKSEDAIARFGKHVAAKAGQEPKKSPEGDQMLQAALTVLGDLKKAVKEATGTQELCIRRVTEAEAASEAAIAALRKTLQGPRLILV